MAVNGGVSRMWRSEKMDGALRGCNGEEEVHVLAVDDSVVDRKVIEHLLKISSCKVTAVDSGRRALQFLGLEEEPVKEEEEEELKSSSSSFSSSSSSSSFGGSDDAAGDDHEVGLKVDLIITDYCMPGMTGYELLKKIKESSTLREIPVVIMSSEKVMARIDRCLEEGAEDFIVKPVKLSDVKRLRDYMTSREVGRANKRKLQESSSNSCSSDDLSSSSSSPSQLLSSSSTPSSFSCPSSPSRSPNPPPSVLSSSSAPSSPSPLDSPTRRLEVTASD